MKNIKKLFSLLFVHIHSRGFGEMKKKESKKDLTEEKDM